MSADVQPVHSGSVPKPPFSPLFPVKYANAAEREAVLGSVAGNWVSGSITVF